MLCAKLLWSCLTLCDAMDCNTPDSSVHGILQARVLEWVAVSDGFCALEVVFPAEPAEFFSSSSQYFLSTCFGLGTVLSVFMC